MRLASVPLYSKFQNNGLEVYDLCGGMSKHCGLWPKTNHKLLFNKKWLSGTFESTDSVASFAFFTTTTLTFAQHDCLVGAPCDSAQTAASRGGTYVRIGVVC